MEIIKMSVKEITEVFDTLSERFGFDKRIFYNFNYYKSSKGRIFIASKEISEIVKAIKFVTLGFIFCRKNVSVKPSSNFIQIFGKAATKNFIDVNNTLAMQFILGYDLAAENTKAEDGYVIIRYKNYSLGVGMLKENTIKNMLPKGKRMNIEINA